MKPTKIFWILEVDNPDALANDGEEWRKLC
jgi:hypothetical protein